MAPKIFILRFFCGRT